MTPLEAVAVACGLAYLVLAIRERAAAWVFGLASTLVYIVVCLQAGLRLQAALQVFYAAVAVYGWLRWRREAAAGAGEDARTGIVSWTARQQLPALLATAALTLACGLALRQSGSTQPWLEAATSAGGLVATWLAARKVLQNWAWWLVINPATAWLYWQQALPASAGLYLAYAALAVVGWRQWTQRLAATA
jgi:nicotinamide mononucleotide transporter